MKKIKTFLPILIAGFISGSLPLFAGDYDAKIHDLLAEKFEYKRVMVEAVNLEKIETLKKRGCLIKHNMRDLTSLDCPENLIPELNLKESRIFYVTDINSDLQIGADKVWAEGFTGNGINVAILDTGIDMDHPELINSYVGGYDFVNNDNYPEDEHGHGTHVAGIITGDGTSQSASKGVAPSSGLYVYKVCNANGACYEDDMIAAMEAALNTNAKIMNISIGGGSYTSENCDSDSLAEKVNWTVNGGMAVVVAAGNDGMGVSSPGCASGAIAVGAVDANNNVPYWSGRGKSLDILAPGLSIYSSIINGYGYMSGTSMATPHVSGVIALLMEANQSLSVNSIKDALYNTAVKANKCYKCMFWWGTRCYRQSEVTCTSDLTGAGVINAYESYLYIKPAVTVCSNDADCSDAVACTDDRCVSGVCAINPNDSYCSSSGWFDTGSKKWILLDQCAEKEQKEQEYRDYYCDINSGCQFTVSDVRWIDTGISQNRTDGTLCDDGQFCTMGDMCQGGVCSGNMSRDCGDGNVCTADSCSEDSDMCMNSWPDCGISDGCCGPECTFETDKDCVQSSLCWSSSNKFILRNSSQFRKFCKCAQGDYGYKGYSYIFQRSDVYNYVNSSNNEIWDVASRRSYLPVYKVECLDGLEYFTDQDYYYSK